MQRRKSVIIISTVVVALLIVGVCIELFAIGRTAPLSIKESSSVSVSESGEETSETPVYIVLKEETPTPSPSPTPIPTLSPSPTLSPTPSPIPEASQSPTYSPKPEPPVSPSNQDSNVSDNNTVQSNNNIIPAATPEQTAKPRPEVIESTPSPTQKPSVTSISLDTTSLQILSGDSWRINITSAPDSVSSLGATWQSSNSSVVSLSGADLSGVTINGKSAGTATITIYSKDGNYTASCAVTVS